MKKLHLLGVASISLGVGVLAMAAGLGGSQGPNPPAPQSPPSTLTAICHQAGSNVIVLNVPPSAVAAHMAHGDYTPIAGTTNCEGAGTPGQ